MSFKFVDKDYTGLDAASATQDASYDLGGLFKDDEAEQIFRLGNTGSAVTTFQITASGLESTITSAVSFSTDGGLTYETTATISGVLPNELTDTIRCKFDVPDNAYLTSGTFLIRVDEV